MSRINWSRVVLGGLAAGLILNIAGFLVDGLTLGHRWEAQMASMGKQMALDAKTITLGLLGGFALGIVMVWVYAAIRDHYNPGPRAAVMAGLITWILNAALPNLFLLVANIFGPRLLGASTAAALVYFIIAALAGGKLYQPARGEVVAVEPGVSA